MGGGTVDHDRIYKVAGANSNGSITQSLGLIHLCCCTRSYLKLLKHLEPLLKHPVQGVCWRLLNAFQCNASIMPESLSMKIRSMNSDHYPHRKKCRDNHGDSCLTLTPILRLPRPILPSSCHAYPRHPQYRCRICICSRPHSL